MDFDPLKAPSFFSGRKDRFFVSQRHLRHPTTAFPVSLDPTASKVNEPLAAVA
jgi:hypothetical protein